MGHGAPQVRFANASKTDIVQARETDTGIGRQFDGFIPHTPVAVYGQNRCLFLVHDLFHGQCQPARFKDVLTCGFHHLLSPFNPQQGFPLCILLSDRPVGIFHTFEFDLLYLCPEFRFHRCGILAEIPGCQIEDFCLTQVMNGPERAHSPGKLGIITGQKTFHLRSGRLIPDVPETDPLMSRIGSGKNGNWLPGPEDFLENGSDAYIEMDGQNTVRFQKPRFQRYDLFRRGHPLVDHEFHIVEFAFQSFEFLLIECDLLVEIQSGLWPEAVG